MKNNLQRSFLEYVRIKNSPQDSKLHKETLGEEIDLYRENQKRIRTILRGEAIGENEYKRCVLCFVIDQKGNVIVEHKKTGEKDVVSGHIKAYEVGLQAVLRELYEELGIGIEEGLHAKQLGIIKVILQEADSKQPCILEIYCLCRTQNTEIRINKQEIEKIENMPFKIFMTKFLNGKIFPYVKAYDPIVPKLVKQVKEKSHKKEAIEWER